VGAGEHHPGAPTPRTKRRDAPTVKLEFGRGMGRAAGLYRAYEKRADPNWRDREDRREEAAEAAREEAAERAAEAEATARQARQARQQKNRQSQEREQRSSRREQDDQQREAAREDRAAEGRRRHAEGLDFDRMRQPCWAKYEEAFAIFKERALGAGTFQVREIPLPPKGMVVEAAPDAESWRLHVKQATLRWHPDRWVQFEALLVDPIERALLKQVTEGMFRSVTRAKLRGFGFVRFPARSAGMWCPTE